MIKVRVSGTEELELKLLSLGADISDMRAAMTLLAQRGARLASLLAPRRTGRLAASITGAAIEKNTATISADTPYAGVINYGWPEHNIQPSYFLQRAIERMPRIEKELEHAITKMIAVKGLA